MMHEPTFSLERAAFLLEVAPETLVELSRPGAELEYGIALRRLPNGEFNAWDIAAFLEKLLARKEGRLTDAELAQARENAKSNPELAEAVAEYDNIDHIRREFEADPAGFQKKYAVKPVEKKA